VRWEAQRHTPLLASRITWLALCARGSHRRWEKRRRRLALPAQSKMLALMTREPNWSTMSSHLSDAFGENEFVRKSGG